MRPPPRPGRLGDRAVLPHEIRFVPANLTGEKAEFTKARRLVVGNSELALTDQPHSHRSKPINLKKSLGGGNQRDGEDFGKWVEADRTTVVK